MTHPLSRFCQLIDKLEEHRRVLIQYQGDISPEGSYAEMPSVEEVAEVARWFMHELFPELFYLEKNLNDKELIAAITAVKMECLKNDPYIGNLAGNIDDFHKSLRDKVSNSPQSSGYRFQAGYRIQELTDLLRTAAAAKGKCGESPLRQDDSNAA